MFKRSREEARENLKYLISGESNQYPPDYVCDVEVAIEALSQPEIIYCRNCKNCDCDNSTGYLVRTCWLNSNEPIEVTANDFCSWAERKDNEV